MATTETSQTSETPQTHGDQGGGTPFLTLILGGFLAAALGYGAAYVGAFSLFGTDDTRTDELAQITASQEARIDQIETLLGAPDEATARLDASDAGLAELQENFGSLIGDIDSLNERLGGVEAGVADYAAAQASDGGPADGASTFDPAMLTELTETTNSLQGALQSQIDDLAQRVEEMAGGDQIAALEQQLADIQSQIEAQKAAIADAESAAEDETRRIATQAAISEIRAALENGNGFSDAAGAYSEASGGDLPEDLAAPAGDGVATLAQLQNSFDDASRDALDASLRVTAGDNPIDRFGAFIKSQTGARALDEREGADPDAVLSRAQARLNDGDLSGALDQLQDLPDEGRDAMSDWIDRAQTRLRAQGALDEISNSTTTN